MHTFLRSLILSFLLLKVILPLLSMDENFDLDWLYKNEHLPYEPDPNELELEVNVRYKFINRLKAEKIKQKDSYKDQRKTIWNSTQSVFIDIKKLNPDLFKKK